MTISVGYILYCVCFNLYCGGFILFFNLCVCVCVRARVCVCGFCNMCVCEGVLVICILYCTLTEVSLNLTEVSLTLTEVFPYLFLIREANARVKLVKTGHGPHFSTLVVICVVLCIVCV